MTQMNLSMKQKQTLRHREQTCGCQGWGEGRDGVGVWGLRKNRICFSLSPVVWLVLTYLGRP